MGGVGEWWRDKVEVVTDIHAMVLEQLARTWIYLVTVVLYNLGNFPDVFSLTGYLFVYPQDPSFYVDLFLLHDR